MIESWTDVLIIWAGCTLGVFIGRWLQMIAYKIQHYTLKCKYPKCRFAVSSTNKRLTDEIMVQHQNSSHPLKEKL